MISVIMSVMNEEKNVGRAIKSVLDQTFEDFEFLVIDDFSNDGTFEILSEFKKKDSRVVLFKNKKNIGLTKSLNFLIEQSKYEVIARQDADDFSIKHRFAKQYNYLINSKYDFCVSRAKKISNNQIIPKLSFYIPTNFIINFKNPFIHGTLMIKKDTLKKFGNYDEKFYYSQDYNLFYKLVKNNVRFKKIKEPLYFLNTNNNISTIHKEEQAYFANCVKNQEIPESL